MDARGTSRPAPPTPTRCSCSSGMSIAPAFASPTSHRGCRDSIATKTQRPRGKPQSHTGHSAPRLCDSGTCGFETCDLRPCKRTSPAAYARGRPVEQLLVTSRRGGPREIGRHVALDDGAPGGAARLERREAAKQRIPEG